VLLQAANSEDEDLSRAQRGDRQAFAGLVRAHQRPVYGLALRMLNRADLAEELAQDVFLKLFHALRDVTSAAHLRFWLRRVTANLAIDRLRQNAVLTANTPAEEWESAAPDNDDDPLLQKELRRLVAELAPQARAVVLLRYQADLDPLDIAEVLEMPVNTVKSHLKRSLDFLREHFAVERRGQSS
jgi:RNA polymerase sigma-70 factor (ECF subfamily)